MTDDGAGPEVQWSESGTRAVEATSFSPEQVSPSAYVRRFTSREATTGLVLVATYVIRQDIDLENGTWNIEQQVKRIVGTDPADVEGTEVWSDSAFVTGTMSGEPSLTYEDAWLDARYRIETYSAENIGWNGQAA